MKQEPLKILYIISSEHIAGTEVHLIHLIKNLDQNKFKPFVICNGGSLYRKLLEITENSYTINIHSRYDFMNIYKIYRFMKKNKIHIVHTHLGISGLIGRIIAKLAGIPVIIHTEHLWSDYNETYSKKKNKMHLFIYKILSILTTRIIPVSYAVQNFIVNEAKVNSNKCTVIYNGIPEVEISLSHKGEHKEGEVHIAIIGRLEVEKGHIYLLKAMKSLEHKKIFLHIIGSGSLEKEITKYIVENDLKNVRLAGFQSDIYSYIAGNDIQCLVLPSIRECFGLVILEAAQMNLFVIAANVGGIPEIIEHKKNGYLVPPKDSKALEKAILYFIQYDTRQMKNNLTKLVKEKYTIKEMAKKTQELYIREYNKAIESHRCLGSEEREGVRKK